MSRVIKFILLISFGILFSQKDSDKKLDNFIFSGNIDFDEENYEEAEYDYRKAFSLDSLNFDALYNLGNSLYKKKLYNEGEIMYKQALKIPTTKENKHKGLHGLGNIFMHKKEYENAAEVYKKALLNNPDDEETRYNYVLAKELAKKNKNDENKKDNKKDNKDNKDDGKGDQKDNKKDNKDNKDDGKGDQKDNNKKEKKDDGKGNQKDDNKKDNKDKKGDGKENETKLSPQQLENILKALLNEEKKVQDKINKKKFKGVSKSNKKDW